MSPRNPQSQKSVYQKYLDQIPDLQVWSFLLKGKPFHANFILSSFYPLHTLFVLLTIPCLKSSHRHHDLHDNTLDDFNLLDHLRVLGKAMMSHFFPRLFC